MPAALTHIRRRGEERRRCRRGERARRWVVERTHSWFNRYRKLLIRWEKKPQNYLVLVHFAAALIVWRLGSKSRSTIRADQGGDLAGGGLRGAQRGRGLAQRVVIAHPGGTAF